MRTAVSAVLTAAALCSCAVAQQSSNLVGLQLVFVNDIQRALGGDPQVPPVGES